MSPQRSLIFVFSCIARPIWTLAFLEEVCPLGTFHMLRNADLDPVLRDVQDRGRTVEGCIKQWFGFVKPNYEKVGQRIQKTLRAWLD